MRMTQPELKIHCAIHDQELHCIVPDTLSALSLQKLHTLLFPLVEGGTVDESHVFYKNVPPGFLGSKKPKSAERVCVV